jgi:mRNA-degrading endonuclease RelE of RelBE toxin-antitoxin system
MAYRVIVTARAEKALDRLPKRDKKAIELRVLTLSAWPHVSNVSRLHGEWQGVFRLRVADYRVLFRVETRLERIEVIDVVRRTSTTY